MKERELIKKIKKLRQIKPNKDWVSLTKREILGEEKNEQILSWLFTPIRRPAFVVRTIMVAVIILTGSFFYLYYLNANFSQISFSNLPFSKNQENQNLVASLEELEVSLNKITTSLENLKNSKNQKEALAVAQVVKVTAVNSQNLLKGMKDKASSKKVLAALTEVENSFQELGETSSNLQIEIIESLFQDLAQRTLSPEDQNRLQKAKDYFNEGKVEEAMILLMRIGQK
jgi:hypothetical protein